MSTNTTPDPLAIAPLSWRRRLAAHAFDEMLILMPVFFFASLNEALMRYDRSNGMGWRILSAWIFFRTFCHLLWHFLPRPKSHATPGLWLWRSRVLLLDGSLPAASQYPLFWLRGLPLLCRGALFLWLNDLLYSNIANFQLEEAGGVAPFWFLLEATLMLRHLLSPWIPRFSNDGPTAQDLRCRSRPFVVREDDRVGFKRLARRIFAVAAFALFMLLALPLTAQIFASDRLFPLADCGFIAMASRKLC